MLETLISWLQTFPLWGEEPIRVDYLEALPGSTAILPQGLQELHRQEDIMGNVTVKNRQHFMLYWMSDLCPEKREHSRWLMAFESWVQSQSAQALAPQFGDVPQQEKITARQERLKGQKQAGRYAVSLTAEYVKIYNK